MTVQLMELSANDPIHLLHVDDDSAFTELTSVALEDTAEQFTVETAPTASAGLDNLAATTYHCIISDYELPGMNGIEFLTAVRDEYPDLPFILFTGKGSEEVASEAISARVTDYLRKGTGTDQYTVLANRIENAVGQYRATRRVRQRERDLERKHDHLSTLFEKFPEPSFAYVFDNDEPYIRRVNEAFTETFGYDPERAVGEHVHELMVPPDQRERAQRIGERVQAGDSVDEVLRRETVEGTRDFWFRNIRMPDEQNDIDGYAIYVDITARRDRERRVRRQREQLQHREEKLIRLRDYTQELMYAETPSETATIALRAVDEILGFDLGAVFTRSDTQNGLLELVEVLNRPQMEKMYGGLPIFFRDAPAGTHSALAWEVFETGESVFINDTAESDRLARKSPFGSLMMYPIGQHGVVLLAATTLDAFTETEELLLDLLATALETAFDRLDRERALRRQRDELKRHNERLDGFVSVVSHDLRHPLTVLDGSLALAEETGDAEHFERCRRAVARMEQLIEDLLALAREGDTPEELTPLSVREVGMECWETVATAEATLALETDRTVRADRSRLKQLLENLFRNAIQHGGETVTVRIGDTNGGFYVADDGPGIPEDDRDDVFEIGYSTTEDGTGFGLNIVRQVVDAHGWEIRVTESGDGGARFEITDVTTVE